MNENNELENKKIDGTGGIDMENNDKNENVQQTVQQPGQNGFVMSGEPQQNNQYNFWQQQAGGMGQQSFGYNNANYFEQQSSASQTKKKKEYKLLKNVGKAALEVLQV